MFYRLKRISAGNFLICSAVLCAWFVYAGLRDGASIHEHFLGLSEGPSKHVGFPPWIAILGAEAILVTWYFLPNPAYSSRLRALATFFGLYGVVMLVVVPLVLSRPINLTIELVIALYVFISNLAYAIFWPSRQDI